MLGNKCNQQHSLASFVMVGKNSLLCKSYSNKTLAGRLKPSVAYPCDNISCIRASLDQFAMGTRISKSFVLSYRRVHWCWTLGSDVLIPHDEIMYSGSGWTYFTVEHPLNRSKLGDDTTYCIDCRPYDADRECGFPVRWGSIDDDSVARADIRLDGQESPPQPIQRHPPHRSASVSADRVNQFVKHAIKSVIPAWSCLLGAEESVRLSAQRALLHPSRAENLLHLISDLLKVIVDQKPFSFNDRSIQVYRRQKKATTKNAH